MLLGVVSAVDVGRLGLRVTVLHGLQVFRADPARGWEVPPMVNLAPIETGTRLAVWLSRGMTAGYVVRDVQAV